MKAPAPQRGIALIEFSLVLIFTAIAVLGVSYLARGIWHATVLHKAAYQAARIVAAMPEDVFRNDSAKTAIPAVARRIFLEVAADAGLESVPAADDIAVSCDTNSCTTVMPQRIIVSAQLIYVDPLFGHSVPVMGGVKHRLIIDAIGRVPYAAD